MEALFTIPPPTDLAVDLHLSFRPFVSFLNEQRRNLPPTHGLYPLYSFLIDRFVAADALIEEPGQYLSEAQLKELFQLASLALLPLPQTNQAVPYAFGLPLPLQLFYCSPAFETLLEQIPDLLQKAPGQVEWQQKKRFIYQLVLTKCYGIPVAGTGDAVMSVRFANEQNGLTRYYQMDINASFFEPRLQGELPPLQSIWIDFVNGKAPLPEGPDALPLSAFTFEGFSFFRIEDITESETIRQLEEVFIHLQSDTEPIIYQRFETALRNLCGHPDLQISLMPMPRVNGSFVHHPDGKKRSIFMRYALNPMDDYNDPDTQALAKKLLEHPVPHVFPGLRGLPETESQALYQQGIRSLLVYPIVMANEELGILEMASSQSDAFGDDVLRTLDRIKPLVQELLRYQLNQFRAEMEQLIRQRFTSLQPAVEWKFYKAAWEELRQIRAGLPTDQSTRPIQFDQVYPLYGAVDIRNSSTERHRAVQEDLANQLAAVEAIFSHTNFPPNQERPDQLRAENMHCQDRLTGHVNPEDEQEIAIFLSQNVNPYFRRLQEQQPALLPLLETYFAQINPETGQFNRALTRYEQTMDRVNTAVNEYVDQEEKQLQAIYPHYFERYRTDGTEYTLYIGQSIAPDQPFGSDVHRRLIGWQLTSMIEMARLTRSLLPDLPLPLQTTQLILAHAHPVDIAFRTDERRFDVEGSYSIRYEVVKKRIDKARIQGTQQRLTQPDTIALVYSHISEIKDYLAYIKQLQESGHLKSAIEFVDLEPMQGIFNLKALRVSIMYAD
jgi:hypothetical protein